MAFDTGQIVSNLIHIPTHGNAPRDGGVTGYGETAPPRSPPCVRKVLMSGFTKLSSNILSSTIWLEPDHVRIVWITMLAMADRFGRVQASVPGLAHQARVELDQTRSALTILQVKGDFDGPYVAKAEDGWQLLDFKRFLRPDRPGGDEWAEIRDRIFSRDTYTCIRSARAVAITMRTSSRLAFHATDQRGARP